MRRLPQILSMMESMIETIQRFEAYQSEVKAISKLGITFREWTLLAPVDKQQSEDRGLIYLIPSAPVEA